MLKKLLTFWKKKELKEDEKNSFDENNKNESNPSSGFDSENPDFLEDEFLSEEEKERREKEKIRAQIKEDSIKEVKKNIKKETRKSLKEAFFKNKYLISNLLLLGSIIFSYIVINDHLTPILKKIEVLKGDIISVQKDNVIVKANLDLLKNEKDKALEYRRLNYFLDQAVPQKDNYEDNLIVILNILNEAVTDFSKNRRYLSTLNLKPDTKLKDVEVFNTETERVLAISYGISVEGFERYKDIKDFINLITGRVRIFHISKLTIAKTYDQKIKKAKYKLSFKMYSYYRLPQLDAFGNIVDKKKEATFQ